MPGASHYPGPEKALGLYEAVTATGSGGSVGKGAKSAYTSRIGHMFSFLDPEGTMALRLSPEHGEKFLGTYDGGPVVQYGSVMRGYVSVPASLLANTAELVGWFDKAHDWISSLPPNATTKKT